MQRIRDESGLSLKEVEVTTFIVMIVMLGMVAFHFLGRVSIDREEMKRVALSLAQSRLESFQTAPPDSVRARTDTRLVSGVTFTLDTAVQNDTPEAGLRAVTVTVTWPVTASTNRSLSLYSCYNVGT